MNSSFYQQNVTTIATCFWLKLKNGTVIRLTDHHQDLEINQEIYQSNNNFEASAISKSIGLSHDNLNISGIISHNLITIEDIKAGLYDQSIIKIFQVDYTNPQTEQLLLQTGFIGQIKIVGQQFFAEINSLEIKTNQNIVGLYSPNCRVRLGCNSCSVDLAKFTYQTIIVSIISSQKIIIKPINLSSGYFNYGFITLENGYKSEISKQHGESITLAYPLPQLPESGETIYLTAGCNKTFEACCNKFDNALNFRGEPHLPGLDKLFQTPGTL